MASLTDNELYHTRDDERVVHQMLADTIGDKTGDPQLTESHTLFDISSEKLFALRRYLRAITKTLTLDDDSILDLAMRIKRK